MDKRLAELVDRLSKTYGDSLVSVMLYGSAAVGETQDKLADLNVLCVLRQVTVDELAPAEPIFRWWRQHGNPSPLLLSEEEVERSTDCFPIEFHDIKERHCVLYGRNVVEELPLDNSFYRARVEYEFRSKLLRLRQKAAGVLNKQDLLLKLMLDSLSTFCVLLRHALCLAGHEPKFPKREVVRQARETIGLVDTPFLAMLDLREGKSKPKDIQADQLFRQYLAEIQKAVDFVDRLQK